MKSSSIGSNLFRDLEMIEEAQIFRTPILNLILAAVLQPSFLGSEQNNLPLNNEDVVKLAHSRLSESVIIRVIEAYESNFDTTRKALLSLRESGVGDKLLEAMRSKTSCSAVGV